MNPLHPTGGGRLRVAVREIPCESCHSLFGQTAHEKARKINVCPECARTHRSMRVNKPRKQKDIVRTNHILGLEVVLPKTRKPHLCRHRNEWYMKVRTRKRNTDEKLQYDRIWLGVFADADTEKVQSAFTAAFARLQGEGASDKPREHIKAHRKLVANKKHQHNSWEQGAKFRGIGITRVIVKKVMYTVHLPDPLMDGKVRYIGRFETKPEARKARKEAYKEMVAEYRPCAVCGKLPMNRRGMLTHISNSCDNVVQFPAGVRPLLQTKMWNLLYSQGTNPPGKLTCRDLAEKGFMFKHYKGKNYYVRNDVEKDFSLAGKYTDEEAVFE